MSGRCLKGASSILLCNGIWKIPQVRAPGFSTRAESKHLPTIKNPSCSLKTLRRGRTSWPSSGCPCKVMLLTSRNNFSYLSEISDAGEETEDRQPCCSKTSWCWRCPQWDCGLLSLRNSLPSLCFSSLGLLGESQLWIFSRSPVVLLVCDLGCGLDDMFDPVYRSPPCDAARCSSLAFPLPASFDLIHK